MVRDYKVMFGKWNKANTGAMKTIEVLVITVLLVQLSCTKNDDAVAAEMEQKDPPLSFALIAVPDGAINIDVTPTLSWESAKNPKGSEVTYELFLDEAKNPSRLIRNGIPDTTFQMEERLDLVTDYYWKVVATDPLGQKSQSNIHRFTTRSLNFLGTAVTASADFSQRDRHSSVVFDNKMWVIGGFFNGERKNDIWYSVNGENWTMATASAQFSERTGQATVVFDEKIWLIGGFDGARKNDVWYSEDGVNWIQATAAADFPPRSSHTAIAFDEKVWIIGGSESDFELNNDIWYSSNGIDWMQATADAGFLPRIGHTSTVFENKIWVIGGAAPMTDRFNDIWYSNDGVNWNEVVPKEVFSGRSSHSTTVFDNKLWVIGGQSDTLKNDVWYSEDGSTWIQVIEEGPFSARRNHTAVAFSDKLWVIAGTSSEGFEQDVWAMD